MTKKNLIKISIIYFPLLCFGLYGVLVRQRKIYNEYDGMRGTVVESSTAYHTGRTFCTIRLENGVYGTVNNGYDKVEIGDTWINDISYSPFLGTSGIAYCIIPKETQTVIENILFILLLIVPLFLLIFFLFLTA